MSDGSHDSLTGRPPAGAPSRRLELFFDIDPAWVALAARTLGRAAELGRTPAQVALAWILAQPDVTVPLVVASRPDQLDDTVAAFDLKLSPEHLDRLDRLSQPFR